MISVTKLYETEFSTLDSHTSILNLTFNVMLLAEVPLSILHTILIFKCVIIEIFPTLNNWPERNNFDSVWLHKIINSRMKTTLFIIVLHFLDSDDDFKKKTSSFMFSFCCCSGCTSLVDGFHIRENIETSPHDCEWRCTQFIFLPESW